MSMLRHRAISPSIFLLAGLGLVSHGLLFAQAVSGDVAGAVIDASGASVPGAGVSAVDPERGLLYSTTTNDRGEYRFANLPAGSYDLSATANGFAKSTLHGVAVQLNQTATANLRIQVAGVASALEVVEAGPGVDTTTAQVQNTYGTRQAEDLPVTSIGLGVLNLSLLSAGVGSSGGVPDGSLDKHLCPECNYVWYAIEEDALAFPSKKNQ